MIDNQRGVPIIIDNGSFMCKAGIAGNAPSSVFPTVVGKSKNCEIMLGMGFNIFGEEALAKRGTFLLTYPI